MEPAPAPAPSPKTAEVPAQLPRIESVPAPPPTIRVDTSHRPAETPAPTRIVETVSVPDRHGKLWAANTGWVVSAVGLTIAIYSLWWERANHPDQFAPSGVPVLYAGAAIAFLGVVVGFVFSFVPWKQTHPIPPNAPPTFWSEQASEVRDLSRSSQIASWIGVGFFLLGLILVAYVFWQGSLAGPGVPNLALGGLEQPHETWAALFGTLAIMGILFWAVYGTRATAYRNALYAFVAAAQPRADPRVPMGSMGASISVMLPAGVRMEDVVSLMKKIDGLLATLPDDTVAQFSKTPEAETYLKLLSGK